MGARQKGFIPRRGDVAMATWSGARSAGCPLCAGSRLRFVVILAPVGAVWLLFLGFLSEGVLEDVAQQHARAISEEEASGARLRLLPLCEDSIHGADLLGAGARRFGGGHALNRRRLLHDGLGSD